MGMTTLSPSFADCLKIWGPQPPGTSGLVQAYRDGFNFFTAGKKKLPYTFKSHKKVKCTPCTGTEALYRP